jgi:transposase
VVLSVDEKSQIQALDRTQPGLPLKKGRAGTMTHDYKRHGTTTLFAALNVLDGTVIGRCMQRHRHQEFIRFLNAIEAAVPAGKIVHVILDNYAAHKQPKVLAWLARHPRFVFHLYGAISVKRWVASFISFFDRTTTISSSRPGKASPLARSRVGWSSVEEQRLALPVAGRDKQRCRYRGEPASERDRSRSRTCIRWVMGPKP